MDLEDIVKKLEEYGDELPPQALRSVAADIYYSGEATAIVADSSLVGRLFDKWKNREYSRASINEMEPRACPICKLTLEHVKLDEDRPALWCPRHFVVFPVKSEDGGDGE